MLHGGGVYQADKITQSDHDLVDPDDNCPSSAANSEHLHRNKRHTVCWT